MGLLRNSWMANYRGHAIVVSRNEVTRGFTVKVDDQLIGRRWFTMMGIGEVTGQAELEGRSVAVEVKLSLRECALTVDAQPVDCKLVS